MRLGFITLEAQAEPVLYNIAPMNLLRSTDDADGSVGHCSQCIM
jgi:hypothetical protein